MNLIFKRSAPFLALLGLVLGGCQPDLNDDPQSSAGQADFSRYIAVGNSLTAGFGDNGVYREGQLQSFPAILAGQFQQVGGGNFVQPVFPEANANGSGFLRIASFTPAGTPVLGQVAPNGVVGLGADGRTPLLVRFTGSDNQNLGVPGIRVADIATPGYGFNNPLGFNPYFERLLAANDPRSYTQYVQERVATIKPTFFTNWLGNNDVLGYASSGGTAAPLSDPADFRAKYTDITNVLTAGGAKGVVITIPNVANVPLFTTVPTAAVIGQVRAGAVPPTLAAQLTAGLSLTPAQAATIRFGFFIETATGAREATAADLLLLTSSGVINTPSTTANPFPVGVGISITGLAPAQAGGLAAVAPPNALPSRFVLDAAEVAAVQARTTELNNIIKEVGQSKGLAVFDANTFFNGVARNGIVVNGVGNSAAFVSGNLFSLDGVHPTPRGYAVIANEIIKVINATYGAAVPGVDPTTYRGVQFP
ncbi:hypothetical protein [Hymenobacter sp. IS2118]|uniref:hypothetical protein n=1 Tax=Hymenobacter sp. IS2118 TaxID=1505605 RepID=UPI0005585ACD|nr:hypothetical protein [Hymenobacter sp. IS2118]